MEVPWLKVKDMCREPMFQAPNFIIDSIWTLILFLKVNNNDVVIRVKIAIRWLTESQCSTTSILDSLIIMLSL